MKTSSNVLAHFPGLMHRRAALCCVPRPSLYALHKARQTASPSCSLLVFSRLTATGRNTKTWNRSNTCSELEVDHEVGDAGVHDRLAQGPRELHSTLCDCVGDHTIHPCCPLPACTAASSAVSRQLLCKLPTERS